MIAFEAFTLTKNQQSLANFITKNMDNIAFMTEKDIADACMVSSATVSRFWGAIGYKNFKTFKKSLHSQQTATPVTKTETTFNKYGQHPFLPMLNAHIHNLETTLTRLSEEDFRYSSQMLIDANCIHVYGNGAAQFMVDLVAFRLSRFDCKVNRIAPSGHEIFENLIHFQSSDVVVVFGFMNYSPELQVIFDLCQKQSIPVILITDRLISPMRDKAAAILYSERGENNEFHSLVSTLAIVEALILEVGRGKGASAITKLKQLQDIRKQYASKLPKQ
ncbi:MurR/RpiR family transcriptional regulator [Alkalicoccobacillus murimartini]|uniref:DNA-binding MurR/RpiR family transcriptional regulator n=1 Tax=Alkalicoccobacillus murimartini TaxID=171685 RepID=A0ABT9YHS8_9BACI|nr:MurR/RpiR family transcriptional regulator [Alkalicoccobacillus murimartini]MDQ0207392.1 DNA-binding MurR/RpiR family transcriptional regulator [Alkalicoccobacillus murimartini]